MYQHPDASKRSRGFTLVEALVALALLTVGLIPAFELAASATRLATSVRNSLIAAQLAQEGTEIIRAVRDNNWFAAKPFDLGLTGCDTGCRVQYDSVIPEPLASSPPLKRDPSSGLYQYTTGEDTLFSRKILVTAVSPHELKVISEISWQERQGAKTFSIESHLYDWLK